MLAFKLSLCLPSRCQLLSPPPKHHHHFSSSKQPTTHFSVSVPHPRPLVVSATASSMAAERIGPLELGSLPEGLRPELMPRHVAVILDGNRRWAAQKGLPVAVGHHAGGQKLAELVSFSMDWGVKVVSVFAFSTENWRRPKEEVDFLMKLFEDLFNADPDWYASKGVQVRVIGDKSGLPKNLQVTIEKAEQLTKANSSFQLICAINYSGKYDITQACKSIAEEIKDGLMEPEDINKDLFEQHLLTNGTQFPEPDLLIRTSGEHRVSNFMLWQLAYSELVFIDKLWPDFAKEDYVEALKHFQKRERRYGGRPL